MNKRYVDLRTIVTSDAILGFALHSKSFTRRTYNTVSQVFDRIYLRITQVSKLYVFWFDIEAILEQSSGGIYIRELGVYKYGLLYKSMRFTYYLNK